MKLHELQPNPGARRQARRLGRGHGSGRGKTAGRGTKGQKARAGGQIPPRFEGGQIPLVKRLPFKRGIGHVLIDRVQYAAVNLRQLNEFPAGSTVNAEDLARAGVLRSPAEPYKVLGDGELAHPLEVHAPHFSASARAKIEAVGGKAVETPQE
ncbi:MAG: 50S ribosomal protein L15 [Chloroflexi bacterium]|nr:50S ribosomal protein L15 [Chloroflexota bacterium]